MSLHRVLLVFAILFAILGGCATTGAPPPADPRYQQGRSAFEGGRWLEAIANLRRVVNPACLPVSTAECPRIVLLLMRSALELGNPAQAVIDASYFEHTKSAEPRHDPAIAALREQAAETLRSAWRSGDRSIQLQISVTNDVQEPYRVVKMRYELDLREQVDIPPERLAETYLVDIPAPAGSHLLYIYAEYAANGNKRRVGASRSFTTRSGDGGVHLLVRFHNATGNQKLNVEIGGVAATTDLR